MIIININNRCPAARRVKVKFSLNRASISLYNLPRFRTKQCTFYVPVGGWSPKKGTEPPTTDLVTPYQREGVPEEGTNNSKKRARYSPEEAHRQKRARLRIVAQQEERRRTTRRIEVYTATETRGKDSVEDWPGTPGCTVFSLGHPKSTIQWVQLSYCLAACARCGSTGTRLRNFPV